MQLYTIYWQSLTLTIATLWLHQVTSAPAALKTSKRVARAMDWDNLIKLEFLPYGVKKEMNLDAGLFAVRSKKTIKFGPDAYNEEDEAESKRKRRALDGFEETAPCHKNGGSSGGGTGSENLDYDEIAERRRRQRRRQAAKIAQRTTKTAARKRKLVTATTEVMEEKHRRRRQLDESVGNTDFLDRAKESMERVKDAIISVMNKVRDFGQDIAERVKN